MRKIASLVPCIRNVVQIRTTGCTLVRRIADSDSLLRACVSHLNPKRRSNFSRYKSFNHPSSEDGLVSAIWFDIPLEKRYVILVVKHRCQLTTIIKPRVTWVHISSNFMNQNSLVL